ncbi:LytTR family DNA-binding domain-containing protein [Phaeodactylibacter sp.]|uniref:LytR/AlgR family response regulator transcription factor n=1 Tax=Phaeodactylibacter sp. TaxID=1940289 RepID=UPI0025F91BB9|nr:LytTR family DNA-binding domain-containing protein [Phaeodactylibacter sp.]MCI4648248.1 LytTR family DNA-binding domain-containing protein [Phaeodactylibacter sp.]MCI5091897.1 LytTR family DNA-binding domain-containing protein [Phaeodactylibacter sp.]
MYTCYIIDDEPIAIDIIRHYLSKLDEFVVIDSFEEPLEAFTALKQQPADLIFLDIQMPGLSGLELLKALSSKPAAILTTAHREYAVDGFELDVVDYLLKPIEFQRFLKAIDKFMERQLGKTATPGTSKDAYLLVRAERKSLRIRLRDIRYIEGLKDYVKIILPDRTILTKELIGTMEDRLPEDQFFRLHRSFIVPRDKIDAFTAMDVEIGGQEIPIGRTYKEAFKRWIQNGLDGLE